jgi:hypothetical protein
MEDVWIEGYVLCGEANKFYRCVTCNQSCGIEGHFIEETKSKNPKREFVNNTSKWDIEDFEKVIDQEAIDYSVYNEQINKAVQAAVKHGINLQRKRSYSEEEVINLLDKFGDHIDEWYSNGFNTETEITEKWFHKNKKK